MTRRHRVPLWMMGLTNLTYGFYGGVVAFAVPQLLGDRHRFSETAIAGLTAISFSPGFWAFLLSPVLDVRFSRRWYATVLAVVSAVTLVVAFLNLNHLILLEIVLTVGFFAAYLYQSAIGGWLASITTGDEEKTLSIWMVVGNTSGFGIMAIGCNQLVHHFSPLTAALILAAVTLLPIAVFPFMQAPGADRRLASESFPQFLGDLVALVKRREVLIAIVLFITPAGTFSLTNFLGAHGNQFHASPGFVGLIGGIGVVLGGLCGSLSFRPLSRLMPTRPLYLTIGLVGGLGTLALTLLPHTPVSFAVIVVTENIVQSLAITVSIAIAFQAIGRDNPLASTTFCAINSAYGVPISYMLYVDAFGFRHGGIAGSLTVDALAGIVASLLMGLMLFRLSRKQKLETV